MNRIANGAEARSGDRGASGERLEVVDEHRVRGLGRYGLGDGRAVDDMREELDEFRPPRAPHAIRGSSARIVSHPARIRLDSGDRDPALLERSGAVRETLPCHVEIPDRVVENDAGCLVTRPDEMVDHRPRRQGPAARGGVGHTPLREDGDSQTGSSSGP